MPGTAVGPDADPLHRRDAEFVRLLEAGKLPCEAYMAAYGCPGGATGKGDSPEQVTPARTAQAGSHAHHRGACNKSSDPVEQMRQGDDDDDLPLDHAHDSRSTDPLGYPDWEDQGMDPETRSALERMAEGSRGSINWNTGHLIPPATAGSDCEVAGDRSICWYPMETNEYTHLDILEVDSGCWGGNLVITPQVGCDNIILIRKAWTMLRFNFDLVEWAICWVTGEPEYAERVRKQLDDGGPVVVKINHKKGVQTSHDNDSINLGMDGVFARYVRIYASTKKRQKRCAIIDLAVTLFHELTHVCDINDSDDMKECDTCCYTSYLMENALRWAIYKRYVPIYQGGHSDLYDTCCRDFVGQDLVFLTQETLWPMKLDTGCLTW